jgi:hypothetical protein
MVEVKQVEYGIISSELPPHAVVSKELLEDETAKRMALTDKPHAFLVKLRGLHQITDDAWDIISGDLFDSITTALAIFHDKNSGYYEHGKIMVDLKFQQGTVVNYPVKYFDNEETALDWLRSFVGKDVSE